MAQCGVEQKRRSQEGQVRDVQCEHPRGELHLVLKERRELAYIYATCALPPAFPYSYQLF